MTSEESILATASLCRALMRADTEGEVIDLLKRAGYWDDPSAWRPVGDLDNNFSSIGNQQSEAVAALVEKIVNGVDSRLIDACRRAGIDPEGSEAPSSMREAVARLIENRGNQSARGGRIGDWVDAEATEQGRQLTVTATGNMPEQGQPSLSIADGGEGQTPDAFPDTFMSLQKNNKLKIPFVQGKFNMGGTGALQFCGGAHNLQLIVSRRNPQLVEPGAASRDAEWGFTVVRREPPAHGRRSSVYTYLAPVDLGAGPRRGVLSFPAETLPIFPEANEEVRDAYSRQATHGSLVKLYEYTWRGTKSNIVSSGDGLLRRIDVGLPELALPVRIYECRPGYKGHPGSFSTNALGLVARLDRDRGTNLEDGMPIGGTLNLAGKNIQVRVYAFLPGKAKQYRSPRNAILFSVNGQLHGALTADFFRRKAVGMGYLADSLLAVVDCSDIDGQMREDLFMNSRDRIRETAMSKALEDALEAFFKNEPTLRELQNRRREQALNDRLSDDKPLADVLQGLMATNPLLSRLLLQGMRLAAPFPTAGVGSGGAGGAADFSGKKYPTFFKLKGSKPGELVRREVHIDSKFRLAFETDAEDLYFVREDDPGVWNVRMRRNEDDPWIEATDWSTTGPKNGVAQLWMLRLPEDADVGHEYEFSIEVTDPSRFDAFESRVLIKVGAAQTPTPGGSGKATTSNSGSGNKGGARNALALPAVTPVHQDHWGEHEFNDQSAVRVVQAGDPGGPSAYDFYINVDNRYLKHAQKDAKGNGQLLEQQFTYAMVLLGLSILNDVDESREMPIEDFVARATRAVAPVVLPIIQAIGGLAGE